MSIFDLFKTPNSNTTIAGETAAEGMSPAGVNDVIRALAADMKKWQEDMGAALTAGGSATAMTLTTNSMVPALADGVELGFVAAHTNTGDATLAVDGLVPKAIRRGGDVALIAGNIAAGGHYTVSYDASAHAGAGAWILHNPTFTIADFDIDGIPEEIVPAADDRVAFADASSTPAGVTRQAKWQDLLKVLGMLTPETGLAADDKLAFTDTSADPAGSARTITVLNFLKVISTLETLDEISPDFDVMPIYDYGAGKVKKILTTKIGIGTRQISFQDSDMRPVLDAAPEAVSGSYGDALNYVTMDGYAFSDSGAAERLQIRWSPPFSWDSDVPLKIKLRWAPRKPDTGDPVVAVIGDDVYWRIRALALGDSSPLASAWGPGVALMDACVGPNDEHHTDEAEITPAGAAPGKEVFLEISRLGGQAADTLEGDAVLTAVEVVYSVTKNVAE